MKKHILYIIAFLFCALVLHPIGAEAQKRVKVENLPKYDRKPYHFGFALCVNKMDFAIKPVPGYDSFKDTAIVILSTPQWGFNIGIVSNLRLNEYSDLRFIPTLSFGERILNYTLLKDTFSLKDAKKIESTFIDFPVLIKYKSKRLFNARAYILAGAMYSLDLASQAKKKSRQEDVVKLKSNDFLLNVGVGFDFYLEYFKLSTELKMSYGMRDLLKRDGTEYTNSIQRLNSKLFQLSFLFE